MCDSWRLNTEHIWIIHDITAGDITAGDITAGEQSVFVLTAIIRPNMKVKNYIYIHDVR